mmetsp:Transcript_5051/g.14628  ORF Transcript_5051/g.14628 Transcript_5051/m.14628 type:complete len:90 (+) Transcript_5051:1386-1655(+)
MPIVNGMLEVISHPQNNLSAKQLLTFVEAFLVSNVTIPELNPILLALSQFLSDQFPDPPQTLFRRVVKVVDYHNLVLVVGNPQQFEAGV